MNDFTGTNQPSPQTCSTRAGGLVNRRTLYIGLSLGAAAGLFLGWDWLAAIGAASIIVALAPCLVMCALGLCASRAGKDKQKEVPARTNAIRTGAEPDRETS